MQALAALADPNRRRIVEMLAVKERSAGEIAEKFKISAPAISQHLKKLREAGLVSVRFEGQHRIQVLDFRGIAELETWLKKTRETWEKRFDLLEAQLRADAENDKKLNKETPDTKHR